MRPLNMRHGLGAFMLALALASCGGSGPEPAGTAPVEGRGCNTLQGWFVVDSIRYQSGKLQEIDLRFEPHCEGGTPALHGQVHWVAGA
jgi:hypothetical protein